jgi:diaminopimelate decarboxylase
VTRLPLFPRTADINNRGCLTIGGCDTVELATNFGTPLYIFDEATLRSKCLEYRREFTQRYPNTLIIYACKAFTNTALALILEEEGLGLDVVSAGEISIASSADFLPERVYFHGNNKTAEEISLALEWGIGRVVVDNFHELHLLSKLAAAKGIVQDILLRLSPGIDPHTHEYITTGTVESKFGFPMLPGQAEEAITQAISRESLNLIGLHFHLGSLIFDVEPYREAIKVVLRFAAEVRQKIGFELSEFSLGGGFAIQYVLDSPAPSTADYAEAIVSILLEETESLGLALPQLIVEPGRAIVGQAGVALYRVGAMKEIPGIRKYVFVDGGIADNIRPAFYGARYEALVANKAKERDTSMVTVAGRFCESADILVKDIELPTIEEGDIIAVPACGAYCLPMASNYNASLKPAIVMVKEGQARLIRRRETFEDLTRCDIQ